MTLSARRILALLVLITSITTGFSQPQYAGTDIQKKKVIIEEFTGVRCTACYGGHLAINNIQAEYPNKIIPMAYHPKNSSFTYPFPGDPDLRSSYLDTFFLKNQYGYKAMPTATINRRTWGPSKIISSTKWHDSIKYIIQEDSPLNIGLHITNFDNYFDVDVEVYFTSTLSDNLSIYVHLIEDVDVRKQKGTDQSPYTLKHVFRRNVNYEQWGHPILGSTTKGSLYTETFSDIVPIGLDMNRAHIVVFVYNKSTGEIITGEIIAANGQLTNNQQLTQEERIKIFPNPTSNILHVNFKSSSNQSNFSIYNLLGQKVFSKNILGKGIQHLAFAKNKLNVKRGLYLIQITSENQTYTHKVVFE